ncbi:CDC15 (YAR019C) [Zygosaccharomyces parabailii]|nr:CDC15 (YAR019C) [Zygosaccharomyces parabailii]CDH10360.1 related to Cell division control protein 15 [Zygosaccharomyces bailii ISA1307]
MTERINLTPAQQQQTVSQTERSSRQEAQKKSQIQYQLKQVIGKGSYGIVYKAMNRKTQKMVAIKEVNYDNDDELADIMSEIDLLKNLNHINIVKYHGFIQKSHNLYIILEYCSHGSLKNFISRGNGLPEAKAKMYVKQTLNGLNYLHEQGVIHRDIKAANILLDSNNVVKLADFGVSTKVNTMTMAMTVAGSLNWMAPEIIGNRGASTLSDIWSLGATVLEVLTGNPPFHNLVDINIYYAIENDAFIPPSFLSKEAQDFLSICFQKNMYQRPTAAQLLKHRWVAGDSPANKLELYKESNNDLDFQWDHDFGDSLQETNLRRPSLQHSSVSTSCLPSLAKTRVTYSSASSASSTSLVTPGTSAAATRSSRDPLNSTPRRPVHISGVKEEEAGILLSSLGKETVQLSEEELSFLFGYSNVEDIVQSVIQLLRESSNENLVLSIFDYDKKYNFGNLKKKFVMMGGVPSILEYNSIVEQFFLKDSYKVLIQCGILYRTHILKDSIILELTYKFLDMLDSPQFWCHWCSKHLKIPNLIANLGNRSAQSIVLKLSSYHEASNWFPPLFLECILELPPRANQPLHIIFKALASILIQSHNNATAEIVASPSSKVSAALTSTMDFPETFIPWVLQFLEDPKFYEMENAYIWKYYMNVIFQATHLHRRLLNQLLGNDRFISLIRKLLGNRENTTQLLYVPLSIVMEISTEMTKFYPVLVELGLNFIHAREEFIVGGLEILLNSLQFALHDPTKFVRDAEHMSIRFPSGSSSRPPVSLSYQDLVDPFFKIRENNLEFGNFIAKFIKICFLTPLDFISFKILVHPDFNERVTAFFRLYRNSLLIQIDLLKFVKLVFARSLEYLNMTKGREADAKNVVISKLEKMTNFLDRNWDHQIEGQVGCDSILIQQLCNDIKAFATIPPTTFTRPSIHIQRSRGQINSSLENDKSALSALRSGVSS